MQGNRIPTELRPALGEIHGTLRVFENLQAPQRARSRGGAGVVHQPQYPGVDLVAKIACAGRGIALVSDDLDESQAPVSSSIPGGDRDRSGLSIGRVRNYRNDLGLRLALHVAVVDKRTIV